MLIVREKTLSNEIEAPLNSMLMLLNTLISDTKDPFITKFLLLLNSHMTILLCLINDILDFKLLSLGNFKLRASIFSPRHLFDFLIMIFRH